MSLGCILLVRARYLKRWYRGRMRGLIQNIAALLTKYKGAEMEKVRQC